MNTKYFLLFYPLSLVSPDLNNKMVYTLFYKNNFIRTRLKFAQKLRTSLEQLRFGFRCKCNCKFFIVITCRSVLQLGTPSEQRRKSKLCRTCFMTVPKCIIRASDRMRRCGIASYDKIRIRRIMRAFPRNFEEIIKNYGLKLLNIFFVKKDLHSFRIFFL